MRLSKYSSSIFPGQAIKQCWMLPEYPSEQPSSWTNWHLEPAQFIPSLFYQKINISQKVVHCIVNLEF